MLSILDHPYGNRMETERYRDHVPTNGWLIIMQWKYPPKYSKDTLSKNSSVLSSTYGGIGAENESRKKRRRLPPAQFAICLVFFFCKNRLHSLLKTNAIISVVPKTKKG